MRSNVNGFEHDDVGVVMLVIALKIYVYSIFCIYSTYVR